MPIFSKTLSASGGLRPPDQTYQGSAPGPRWGAEAPRPMSEPPLLDTELRPCVSASEVSNLQH